jgi:hypothetical protein
MNTRLMVWLLAATLVVTGIAVDMRRLHANHVWLSLTEWTLICALVGAPAVIVYLILRQRVRRQLIEAAWALMGDGDKALSYAATGLSR